MTASPAVLPASSPSAAAAVVVPEAVRAEIDNYLASLWGECTAPTALVDAMREQVLHRGKRVRPALAMATAQLLGHERSVVLPIAAGIELIHTYSLIHDDLPAMDDARTRRGEPTCHVRHGEGVAILIGDALFAEAIAVIVRAQTGPAGRVLAAIDAILRHTSIAGMAGGQYLDLVGAPSDPASVTAMHGLKTGGLFRAPMLGVAAWAAAPPKAYAALERYASAVGCLFQLRDDVLDVYGAAAQLGKPTGADARNGRQTAASAGADLDAMTSRLRAEAADALAGFDEPPVALRSLIDLAGCRDH